MAYTVETVEPVKAYLRAIPGLSRAGRLKLLCGYLDGLRERGDELRAEPAGRLAGSSSLFSFRHIFRDGGRFYVVRLVVDDSAAVFGVLRVVYADCWSG